MSLPVDRSGFNNIGFFSFSENKDSTKPINIKKSYNKFDEDWSTYSSQESSENDMETPIIITSDISGQSFSHESSQEDFSDSISWTTSTLTSRSGSSTCKTRKMLLSSTSCPEENSVLESPSEHVSVMLNGIKNSKCPTKERVGYNFIFGKRKEACFPFVEQHIHLEGVFTAEELLTMAVNANLFYDPARGVFRRKCKEGRIPASQVLLNEIKSKACVNARAAQIFEFDDLEKESPFDETFKIRGSILDRVKLSTQLLSVMKKAKEHNIIYRELMYGIYDVPVPKQLIDFVKKLENPLSEGDIELCIDFLDTKLSRQLSLDEQEKLKTKIMHRFSLDEKEAKEFCNTLLDLNYSDAKELYIKRALKEAELEIKEEVIKDNQKAKSLYGIDPEISIFSKKSVRTLKLIDEIMRHRSLGKFITWTYSAFKRIQKMKGLCGIEVGVTVDGPQNKKAKINFESQINFLLKMRKLFPDVPVSMHALEYPTDSEFEITDELEQVIKVCEADEQGRGKGRIGHGTRTADVANIGKNLKSLLEKALTIEYSATTAGLTTKTPIPDMPIGYLHRIGVPITFNTDDPGIFDKMTIRSEIAKIIKNFNFTYEDIKNAMRASLESSFADGPSIYVIQEVKEMESVGDSFEHVTRLKYNIKSEYLMYCNKMSEGYLDIAEEISEKAYKQILLERFIENFEEEMFSDENIEISQTLGFRHKRSKSNPEPYIV